MTEWLWCQENDAHSEHRWQSAISGDWFTCRGGLRHRQTPPAPCPLCRKYDGGHTADCLAAEAGGQDV